MKKSLFTLLLITTLASCKMAMFNQLAGVEQTVFPDTLQGSYYVKIPTGWFKKTTKDTLFVGISAKEIAMRDSSDKMVTPLDADHKLVMLQKSYYIWATHHDEYKSFWNYTFVEPTKKGLRCYIVLEDDKTQTLTDYFGRQFVQLNNAGDSVFVYQANDSSLVTYFEKVLKKTDALELVRIKK